MLRTHDDPSSPQAIADYFNFLYYTLKGECELDKKQLIKEIESKSMPFATVAENFHMIENAGYTVYVPRGEGKALIERLREPKISRSLMRQLGQYAVTVYPQHFNRLLQSGAIEKIGPDAAILRDLSLYSEETGLSFSVNEGQAFIT